MHYRGKVCHNMPQHAISTNINILRVIYQGQIGSVEGHGAFAVERRVKQGDIYWAHYFSMLCWNKRCSNVVYICVFLIGSPMSDMQTIYSDMFYSTSWGGLVMMEASHEELNFVGLQINSAKKKTNNIFYNKIIELPLCTLRLRMTWLNFCMVMEHNGTLFPGQGFTNFQQHLPTNWFGFKTLTEVFWL